LHGPLQRERVCPGGRSTGHASPFKGDDQLPLQLRKNADHALMERVKTLKIKNDLGLHARCAAKIVALAGEFRSKIYFTKNGHEVDGSSILSLLTLACPKGTELQVRVSGEDAEALVHAMTDLFDKKFGE
jgi:phosphocarrier protein HPr